MADRERMNPRVYVLTASSFAFGSAAFIFAGMLEKMAVDLGVSTGVAGQLRETDIIFLRLQLRP